MKNEMKANLLTTQFKTRKERAKVTAINNLQALIQEATTALAILQADGGELFDIQLTNRAAATDKAVHQLIAANDALMVVSQLS